MPSEQELEDRSRIAVLEAQYKDLKRDLGKLDGKVWGILITNLITLGAVVAVLAKL